MEERKKFHLASGLLTAGHAANAINEAGQIAGMGVIGGQTHAFLLTPIPHKN
jgi:hypothetical protein